MNTNEMEWIHNMQKTDTSRPVEKINGETIYTLYMADFAKLPFVDFSNVATLDVHVRALFN